MTRTKYEALAHNKVDVEATDFTFLIAGRHGKRKNQNKLFEPKFQFYLLLDIFPHTIIKLFNQVDFNCCPSC